MPSLSKSAASVRDTFAFKTSSAAVNKRDDSYLIFLLAYSTKASTTALDRLQLRLKSDLGALQGDLRLHGDFEIVLSVSDLYSPSNSMPKALRTSSSRASFWSVCVRPASSVSEASTKADSTDGFGYSALLLADVGVRLSFSVGLGFCAVADVFVGGLGVKKDCILSMKDLRWLCCCSSSSSTASVARSGVRRGRLCAAALLV